MSALQPQVGRMAFATATLSVALRPPRASGERRESDGGFRAKHGGQNDAYLQAAIRNASLRVQETNRPEPLFHDPYASCFTTPDIGTDLEQCPISSTSVHHYCLATKFIDDNLLSTMNRMDTLKQVVLLTDGMDTRPYRLNWPNSTIIFDVSPESVFRIAAEKLEGIGAKIPRSCIVVHVPSESPDIKEMLCRKGFNGSRPSVWAFQGLPLMTLAGFKHILFFVSSLAMKECIFLGELPAWLADTEIGTKHSMKRWMDKLFMGNGFRVEAVDYNEVSRNMGKDLQTGDPRSVLFIAEQLRLSDDQMESWRREFQRTEEGGDEDGFEEL